MPDYVSDLRPICIQGNAHCWPWVHLVCLCQGVPSCVSGTADYRYGSESDLPPNLLLQNTGYCAGYVLVNYRRSLWLCVRMPCLRVPHEHSPLGRPRPFLGLGEAQPRVASRSSSHHFLPPFLHSWGGYGSNRVLCMRRWLRGCVLRDFNEYGGHGVWFYILCAWGCLHGCAGRHAPATGVTSRRV